MSLFRIEAIEHKRRKLHGEVILVQPVRLFIFTIVFFLITVAIVFFLMRGEFLRKESVVGYINPSNGLSIIRADQGGRLTQVFVNEGDQVVAGQVLFESRVDVGTEDGFVAERRLENTDVRLLELREQEGAIKRRFKLDRERLRSQINNMEREIAALRSRRNLQEKSTKISLERLQKYERLRADETVTELEYNNAQAQNINEALNLEAVTQQLIGREGNLSETRFSLRSLGGLEAQEISQLDIQISQLEESRTALEAFASYVMRSPVSGTITALEGQVGQAIIAQSPIMMIVPENSKIIATLLAPTRTAAFLEPGQDVNLLIDAFPYQKFGVQKGVISEISATPFRPGELDAPVAFEESVYRIKVNLEKETVLAYGNEVPLKSGMTLQGDLITDRRTLMQWMLDPLFTLKRS